MSLNGINGAKPISSGTKLPSKPAANTEKPQVSERSQKIQELLEQQVNGLDAFVESGQETMDAVVARLKNVAPEESTEQLQSAFRAMRTYAVIRMLKPDEPPKITESLKVFSRLWIAANQAERQPGNKAPAHSTVNLDFGIGFNLLISRINGMDITFSTRK